MQFLREKIEQLDKPLYLKALAVSIVFYFAAIRLLQDYLYRDSFSEYVSLFFSGFIPRPEPLEIPLYFVSYLIVPVAALGLYWLYGKKAFRVGASAAGVLAVAAAAVKLSGFSFPDPGVYLGYVQDKGLGRALWLLLTKRTFVLSLMTGTSAVFFFLVYFFWRPKFSQFFERHYNPDILKKLTPALLVVIAFLVFSPNLPYEEHHYNFVIGTVNDLSHGKSFLSETSNQYGILNIYFLYGIFGNALGVGYEAFSFVLFLFYLGFYVGLFYLIRLWLKSDLLAYLGIGAIVAATYFLQVSPTLSALFYPSLTPFRYGFFIVPLLLLLAYSHRRKPWIREAIIAASGIGVLWNFDFGVYSALATYAVLLYSEVVSRQESGKIRSFLWLSVRFVLYLALVVVLVSLLNRALFGVYPQWADSLRQTFSYTQGVAQNPLPIFGFFEVYVFVYLSSALYLAYRYLKQKRVDLIFLFVVVFGIFSLNYYIANSAWNLLYHIAVPFILTTLYFARHQIQKRLVFSAFMTVLFFSLFVLAAKVPVEFANRDYSYLGEYVAAKEYNELVEQDAHLISEEYGFLDRVPLIHQRSARMLITADKANYFDFYDLGQLNNRENIQIVIDKTNQDLPEYLFVETKKNDQIEYILERIPLSDQYEIVRSLNTLDVYQKADR